MSVLAATQAGPSPRTRRRRTGLWAVLGVLVVAVAIAAAAITAAGQWTRRGMLDPDSTGADGARALAHILGDHGVDVRIVRDRAAVRQALQAAGGTDTAPAPVTLAFGDSPYLSDAAVRDLADRAASVVVVAGTSRTARELFGSQASGVAPTAPTAAGCRFAPAVRAGAITAGTVFRVPTTTGTQACFRTHDGAALLHDDRGGISHTLVDGTSTFTNATLATAGNAALGVNLLGAHRTLIWYVPSAADADTHAPTLGEITPGWVSPAIVLLLIAGIVAGIWRGRRLGPLVAERLPVTVRATETTEGRARLYARSRDAAHAADRLRMGALVRSARLLGLGSDAAAGDIADAVAARLRLPRADVRAVLIDAVPRTDAQLQDLSDRLADLEAALRPTTGGAGPRASTSRDDSPTTHSDHDTDPGRNPR